MKLKQQPEDFRVEELTDVTPGREGPFAFYRLETRGWTTPDAIQAIRRRWQVDLHRLSYGGLKDRHAWTIQYLTIFHGPQRKLTHHTIALDYLGQVFEPFQSRHIRSNRFQVTLRALTE
ncbi:MAG TPA: tRNA pseudouridine(13) synthase TruD, partial [Gemmataceae bacterium]|nr:tRNA pseudouridine(13) synthase TruD [Gemmataceae bacterium]